jgi:DNA-binding transcriptional LysR family regulator
VRSTQGVEPTEFGRLALRRARVVDAELRKLHEELDGLSGHGHGTVSIGLSSTAETVILPAAFVRFREQHPDVPVSILGGRSSSTIAALREGRIDFAVGPLPPEPAGADLHFERLFSSDLGIVVRHDHPLAGCTDLAALGGVGWLFAVRQADGASTVTTLFRKHGLPDPVLAAHCDSNSALVAMLLQTDLVALTSVAALEPHLSDGKLKPLAIDVRLPPVVQHLITSAMRPLAPSGAALATEFRRASRRFRR